MIGVTGASGQLGAAVLRHLAGRLPSGQRLIAMTRAPARAPALVSLADEVRQADFAAPETLPSAFDEVDTLLIVSVEGRDEDRIEWHRNAVRAAVAAGARRVLYTSFLDVNPASPSSVARVHRHMEADLMAAGLDWVMLRDGPYADNFARRAAAAARGDGIFRMAAGDARLPFISRDDLAEAAAAAILSGASRVVWRLSGAKLLGCAELCALVSAALNKPVRYCPISDEEQAVELAAQGLDDTLIERRVAYGRAIRGGFMTTLTDDFQRLVGRDPTAAADLVRAIDLTLKDH